MIWRYDMSLLTPYSDKLNQVNSGTLLRALNNPDWTRETENLQNLKYINGATKEIDSFGDIGLTLKIERMKTLNTSEGVREWFGETGEFYILTTMIDGSNKPVEYKTLYFQNLKRDDFFPLGNGGMLVSFINNPRWFIDFHMLVMESDSDVRSFGKLIDTAKKEAKLDEISNVISQLSVFDASAILKYTNCVDLFLTILSNILQENGDDHIATIHDFYLKHQAFGQGRHPLVGEQKFQDVELAYTIDLTEL